MPVFLAQFLSGHSSSIISCDDLISQPTGTSLHLPCVLIALCISQNRLGSAHKQIINNSPLSPQKISVANAGKVYFLLIESFADWVTLHLVAPQSVGLHSCCGAPKVVMAMGGSPWKVK